MLILFILSEVAELLQEWLHKGERDLDTARLTLDNRHEYTDIICYHCQQAVEKYLKAYLVYLDTPFEKKHDLGYRIDLIVENDKDIEQFYDFVETLSGYAVEIRYPDDWSEPNIEEAIPDNALIVLLPDYDSILAEKNRELAEANKEPGQTIVHVRIKKLKASRIEDLALQLA